MKRVIALMVLAAALLTLCACGKSKAVKQTEQLISAIGTVSIQSADAIEAAERALAALTDEEQKTVKNGEVLREARQAYEKLPEKLAFDLSKQAYEKVSEAYDIIELLGEAVDRPAHDQTDEQCTGGAEAELAELDFAEQKSECDGHEHQHERIQHQADGIEFYNLHDTISYLEFSFFYDCFAIRCVFCTQIANRVCKL